MRNLLLHIAYNGARYHGYQVQQNAVSVASTFQPVLEKIQGLLPHRHRRSRKRFRPLF